MRVPAAVLAGREALATPGGLATALLGLFLLAFAVTVDFPKAAYGFQSDESTYYSLAHSLASDGDFAYQRQDLVRVWEEFPTGPEGIFLKRGNDVRVALDGRFPFVRLIRTPDARNDRLYFAKSYVYPLAAAPFVWLFGTNGFLVLHAILLTVSFGLAYAFLRAAAAPGPALASAAAFLFASATPVYFVWLTPELFNFACSLAGLFCWAYREVVPDPTRGGFLRSARAPWLGAVLIGLATFSKPTNIVVMLPVLALPLLRRQWRQLPDHRRHLRRRRRRPVRDQPADHRRLQLPGRRPQHLLRPAAARLPVPDAAVDLRIGGALAHHQQHPVGRAVLEGRAPRGPAAEPDLRHVRPAHRPRAVLLPGRAGVPAVRLGLAPAAALPMAGGGCR